MKVVFLSSWFPNRTDPFNGDFVERHALAVSRLCQAAVVYVQSDPAMRNRVFEVTEQQAEALLEVVVYCARYQGRIKALNRLINLWRYGKGYFLGFTILRRKFGKPDILHASILYPIVPLAWFLSMLMRIPFIVSEHSTLYLKVDTRDLPWGWLTRRAARAAFTIAPVTSNLTGAMQRHGYQGNYTAVPNVVDTELFKPAPANVPREKIRFLHVSSMKEEQKNISGILRCVKRLWEIRNDFTIEFIGPVFQGQLDLSREMGIPQDVVVFSGALPHAEIARHMQQAHVLVMFSWHENLPCVILEAMACGLPIVSSAVGGIREAVREEHGILVSPGNESELLGAILFMITHYATFDREVIRRYAVEHFSMATIAGKFQEIYSQALGAGKHV
jgi:glycosyltransferase involved in cell wall biosynthesis